MRARGRRRRAAALVAAAGALALPASPAAAGDGGFAGGLDLPLVRPQSLAVGDFNNDGRPDLAVVSDGLGKVAIFLHTPGGELSAGSPVEAGDYPGLVEVADFNRDGNEDLAVTNVIDAQVSIRLGIGDGTFKVAPAVDLGTGHIPQALVVGDFDSDARDDLAVATIPPTPPNVVRIRMGAGNGTFAAAAPVDVKAVAALAVGDFDSDATEDLVYGSFGTEPAGALLGLGTGGFTPAGKNFALAAAQPRGWAVADFNARRSARRGGRSRTSDSVAVRLGAGDGGFPSGSDLPLGAGAKPTAVAVGDFNSDAREDLVVTDAAGTGSVRVRLGRRGRRLLPGAGCAGRRAAGRRGSRRLQRRRQRRSRDRELRRQQRLAALGTGPAPLAGNLLVNGGFEGPAPAWPKTTQDDRRLAAHRRHQLPALRGAVARVQPVLAVLVALRHGRRPAALGRLQRPHERHHDRLPDRRRVGIGRGDRRGPGHGEPVRLPGRDARLCRRDERPGGAPRCRREPRLRRSSWAP